MNRINQAVEDVQQAIDSSPNSEKLSALHKELDMNMEEYVRCQELKSLAVANGRLSLDEGQTIYRYMGESLDTFNGQSLAVKVTITRVFEQLLRERLGV